jgi:hypothetical protein
MRSIFLLKLQRSFSFIRKNKSPANKLAYQKYFFYRGLELYTDGNYPEALKVFTKSIVEQRSCFFGSCYVLKGEYVLNDFKEALLSFKFVGSNQASNTGILKQ